MRPALQETPMQMKPLGRSGLTTAPLAFGGNVFGWTADAATSFALLDAFVDSGFNLIDTADVYSRWVPGHTGGESETLIGRWLAATRPARPGADRHQGQAHGPWATAASRLQPEWIRTGRATIQPAPAADRPHRPLPEPHRRRRHAAGRDTLAAFADLIAEGKVRAIGASNYSAPRLQQALDTSARLGLPRYETLQPLFNLINRVDYEADCSRCACAKAWA
jgi:aryl-alcohol dehydrogenase-like predicted oxidoreductase